MNKLSYDNREFEKNKKEILKRIKSSNLDLQVIDNINNDTNRFPSEKGNRKYAWEYEIEEYRKKKNLERFYKIGALSGIISLIITIVDKLIPIKELTYTAINYILK